jgi:membrane-associated protease RseP (regulator of RpoE activity)
VDGVRVRDPKTLSRMIVLRRPGDQLVFEWRGADVEARAKGTATLGDRTEAQNGFVTEETLGLKCMDLGPELRRFMGLADEDSGAAIQEVQKNGAAHRAGLRRGDIIVWGGGGDIADVEELRAVLAAAKGSVILRWRRPGLDGVLGGTVRFPTAKSSPR